MKSRKERRKEKREEGRKWDEIFLVSLALEAFKMKDSKEGKRQQGDGLTGPHAPGPSRTQLLMQG